MSILDALRSALNRTNERSLTVPTYRQLSKHYLRVKQGAHGMNSVFKILEARYGDALVDRSFIITYHDVREWLRQNDRSKNTVANYCSVIQRVLRQAWKDYLIEEVPIRDFEIHRTFRDQVLDEEQELSLFNAMTSLKSHIEMGVRFAIRRPIRGVSDLWRLDSDHLVLTGKNAPYIRFRPIKTGNPERAKSKARDTYLPLLDKRTGEPFDPILFDFLVNGRPKECKLLFPYIHQPEHGERAGEVWWEPVGNPKKHWRTLRTEAHLPDGFRFHDLKHCAMTWMLGVEEWTIEQIKELGIQYSTLAIDVYWNPQAMRALEKTSALASVKNGKQGVA